ncbi:sugar ABC transporter substrate-binding protein [Streptomyces sp. DSM 40750]|uniref:sugar ABC transporter substrate-binding protein n=1 Tax=Streptomyces sp. DSM 40750 TaxID=2801030 RepID=UPI00214BFC81|nr:sugar ABC transporter substrate-binding protein [Streptomyces sp. DSM 40750]UUU19070.1 sugar ABC transporter substrate-binding protein [Streptomyces sp. DSM 40750]UUU27585.1 sugar ABC transporter substrate-binding protein [Streptomyces sp. DSM 40750]
MKSQYRWMATGIVVTLALSATACNRGSAGTTTADGKPITIGLAVANLQADFFNQIKQSVEAEAKKKGVKVVVADARGDAATQVNQIQDFISQQVSAIIYIPAGATAAGVPVKAAEKAKIPVITVDRNPEDAPGKSFIATDSVAAAKTLGEYVIKQKGGKGQLAILQGQIGTTPQVDRQKGFGQALAKAPGIKVVSQQTADWAQDKAFSVAQDMLQAHPGIDIFWGQADAMALGAAQAVKSADGKKRLIVGFDGDVAGLKAVRNGTIDATMVQQTQKMGRMSVDTALDVLDGKDVPAKQLQPAFLLTNADTAKADEYIKTHP